MSFREVNDSFDKPIEFCGSEVISSMSQLTHSHDCYSRHVEFAQSAQHKFFILFWKELSNILWTRIYV